MNELFLSVLAIGCIIMFANLMYATKQKASSMQTHVIMMLVCIVLMFAGYYIELKSSSLDMALMGTVVAYFGKPFIMFHSIMVICSLYGFKVPKYLYYTGYCIGGIIFLLVFTNPYTHLYYSYFAFDPAAVNAPFVTENGPLYWLHGGTMIGYFIGCVIVSVLGYLKSRNSQNAKFTIYLVLMVFFGIAGYVVYLTGWSKGYDTTIFGALAGVICLSILFYRYRFFDAVSIVKDTALEGSVTGIIVLDGGNQISYINPTGDRFLTECLPLESLLSQKESEKQYQIDDHVYQINRKEIEDRGQCVCISYEVNDITASANYQALLEREVRERTEKIEAIQRKSIAALASVVEARSLETGQHILRTSEYSRMIAEVLKKSDKYKDIFTNAYIDLLGDVTPLHDVGKVSVPDSILLKPGKLDEAEYEEIKKHAEMGAEIIEKAMRGVEDDKYVDLAIKVALYHHERWDGTGYPKGLSGVEIPIEARIMSVADCFDALVSERCYKRAIPPEEAIAILKEESGTHFDPEVVDAFLKAYSRVAFTDYTS